MAIAARAVWPGFRLNARISLSLLFAHVVRYEQLQQEAQEAERKKEEFLSQQEGSFEDMQLAVAEEMDKTATLIDKKT
jgi:hypothetical protein|eukprot:COSAG06_NODE_1527_length_9194_cov_19.780539_8_plen_78_part_00